MKGMLPVFSWDAQWMRDVAAGRRSYLLFSILCCCAGLSLAMPVTVCSLLVMRNLPVLLDTPT
jgi:hypothetical protein